MMFRTNNLNSAFKANHHTVRHLQKSNKKNLELYRGSIVHAVNFGELDIIDDGVVGVRDGHVVFVDRWGAVDKEGCVVIDHSGKLIVPGFIDTHTHASQYPNVGVGMGIPLLDWLDNYTFPLEAKYTDLKFAKSAYDAVVKRSLKNGITTSCYFGTIHNEATKILAQSANRLGQRAWVGKVNMDMNSPDFYVEQTDQSIIDTEDFVKYVKNIGNDLVQPIITPRFAITCSSDLMRELGRISEENNTLIQSHISENTDEIDFVLTQHKHVHYTDIYHKHNLLNERTIMAHGIWLDDDELDIFKQTGAKLSHCPVSNCAIVSGFLKTRHVLSKGVAVGLGSDISGGYTSSFLESIRNAITVSVVVNKTLDPNQQVMNYKEAFWLATVGGSQVIGQQNNLGNFLPGKSFDAQIINPNITNSPFDTFGYETPSQLFEKFIYCGDDRNIEQVIIQGNQINLTN